LNKNKTDLNKKVLFSSMFSRKEKILLISSNLWYLGEGMLGPLFAVFAQRVGGSVLDISWAWSIYLIIVGILVMFVGKVSDKIGKEKLMVAGYALNAVFTFCYLLVSKPLHLFLVQGGLGVAAALSIPTWMALYAKHADKDKDGFTWGIGTGLNRILTGIAIIIGGLIVTYFSFTTLFVTMGIIQVIATIYQAMILKKR